MEIVKLRNPGPPERGAKAKPSRLALERRGSGGPLTLLTYTHLLRAGWVGRARQEAERH